LNKKSSTSNTTVIQHEGKEKTKINLKIDKKIHQIVILSLIHIFYILLEAFNLFEAKWVSSVIYAILCAGTIGFLWLQKENINYLMPIPFISLIIVGGILEETITITVIFVLYCLYFFIIQYIKKNEIETIQTVILSGITMFTLFAFTLFNQGFVKINTEANVVLFIWLAWCLTTLGLALIHRKNIKLHYTFISIVAFFASVGTFFGFIMVYDNLFAIFNGLIILFSIIVSMLIVFLEETFAIKRFLVFIGINLIAVIIFSFSFGFSFDWLSTMNKALVVDYVLFVPLALITTIVLSIKFYPETKAAFQSGAYSYGLEKNIFSTDMSFLVTYFIFHLAALFSLIQLWDNPSILFLKLLILSIIFVATTVPLNIRVSNIISLTSTLAFLISVMLFLGNVSNYAAFISLLGIVFLLFIFIVINELFLIGEPLTTNLSIVATLVGMVTSIIFFYIEDIPLKEVWTSLTWAFVGIFLFAFGIIFNYIFLRRSGLIIVIFDVAYTIIVIAINEDYRGLPLGIALIVLAIVLLACIFLLRWSERREPKKEVTEEVLE